MKKLRDNKTPAPPNRVGTIQMGNLHLFSSSSSTYRGEKWLHNNIDGAEANCKLQSTCPLVV